MDRILDLANRIGKSSDLVLAAVVVAIIFMMIVRVPPMVLDFLIAANLALSLALLLLALYVNSASKLASLPSLLLLATLFRLGLNVSTTRLVLLDGNAGRVVEAFGKVVVAGNIVVGGVVFLVLTLVQFIVIAKGSERVAEVAARFTLDALPGKQMSIDADLRGGSLTVEDAQARRRALERESQLYGALDGAMKFVKGDAIAGLVILAINIVGGLAIGVLQKGMELSEAAAHYTVLTVGDGLSAQIPALLVSTTAGLIVTRVPGDDAETNLGGDISTQIGAQPRALGLTAGLLGMLAFVPGLPAAPFLCLGVVASVAAFAASRPGERANPEGAGGRSKKRDQSNLVLANSIPIHISMGARVAERVDLEATDALRQRIADWRNTVFERVGLRFPELVFERDVRLREGDVALSINATFAAKIVFPTARSWVAARPDDLSVLGVSSCGVTEFSNRGMYTWVSDLDAERAEQAGYVIGDTPSLLMNWVDVVLRRHAAEFVGIQEARELTDALEQTHPALVGEVLPRMVSLAQLAEILRRLVHEGVSIRDQRAIFEAIAGANGQVGDIPSIVERVRSDLRRQITADLTGGQQQLPVYVLSYEVESEVREAVRYSQSGGPLGLNPDTAREMLDCVRALEAVRRDASFPRPVLLAPGDVRRAVRALLENDFPDLPVVSVSDLVPSVVVQPIGRVQAETIRE